MADTHVTLTGNLTDDPELRFTPTVKDGDTWRDGETSFFRVNAWRDLAEHLTESLAKGARVIVVGQLKARSWETPDGEKRSAVEVTAEEVGPSLRWATATVERASNGKAKAKGTAGKGAGQFNDEPPF